METVESLLKELEVISNNIVEKYVQQYIESLTDKPDYSKDDFFKAIYPDLNKELTQAGVDTFHKSIINHVVYDPMKLTIGVQRIKLESLENLMSRLINKE